MKVRPVRYRSGKRAWQLDLGMVAQEDGTKRRVQTFFKTEDGARGALREAKAKSERHGHDSLALSEAERIRFCAARDQLAAVGGTIEQAVAHYIRHARALKQPIPLMALLNRCIEEKEKLGMEKRSRQQFKCSCLSFIRGREETLSHAVTRDEVQAWVLANDWAPKTQRVYLGDLRALFAWAVEKGLAAENPCAGAVKGEGVKVAKMPDREITAYGPEACEALLMGALMLTERRFNKGQWEEQTVYRRLLGYAALATFGGVRPEEVQKSPRSAVDIAERTAVITGKIAKTSRRRVIDLDDNAAAWLGLWLGLCPDEEMIIPRNFRRLWEGLRKRVGLFPWPHDVLRHTFASMHFAFHKDRARLQAELGHSEDEDTLERHYKSVRTVDGRTISRKMAERFRAIFPPPRYTEAE